MIGQLSSDRAPLNIDGGEDPEPKNALKRIVWASASVATMAITYFVVAPWVSLKLLTAEVSTTEIAMVSPAQAQIQLTSTGTVVPQIVSHVGAKVPGRVAKVHVKEGQRVEAGTILLTLEKADQEAAASVARTQIASAQAHAQTVRAALAEATWRAARADPDAGPDAGPAAAATDVEAHVKSLQKQLKVAESDVRAAQAQLSRVTVNLDYLTIKAPIAGTVIGKPPQVGERVGDVVGERPPGIRLADLTTLAVETDIPEGRMQLVQLGSPCEIVLDAHPSRRFRGKTLEISPHADRGNATMRVKVSFTDPIDGASPDMSARVSFLAKELEAQAVKEPPKLIVPASAIAERDGEKIVFVVTSGNARVTTVTLGAPFGEGFELTTGPPAGTRVVKNPAKKLRDGQRVKEKSL